MPLALQPTIQLPSVDAYAAPDPHGGNLATSYKLVGATARYPQRLRYLRNLHELVPLVHPCLLLPIAVRRMLRCPISFEYRKVATPQIRS